MATSPPNRRFRARRKGTPFLAPLGDANSRENIGRASALDRFLYSERSHARMGGIVAQCPSAIVGASGTATLGRGVVRSYSADTMTAGPDGRRCLADHRRCRPAAVIRFRKPRCYTGHVGSIYAARSLANVRR